MQGEEYNGINIFAQHIEQMSRESMSDDTPFNQEGMHDTQGTERHCECHAEGGDCLQISILSLQNQLRPTP